MPSETLKPAARSDRPRLDSRFWRLWWANAVNCVGDGAYVAALPLLAVTITKNPVSISAISAAEYAPWLLVSIPAGVLVDRRDRVALMRKCQTLQALIAALLTLAVAVHEISIPLLLVNGFLLSCAQVVITNAAQAVLPQLVPAELLQKANSNQYVIQQVGQSSAGPPLGSLLFTVTRALPFGVNAASFAASAALLAGIPEAESAGMQHTSIWASMLDGLRWLWRHKLLRSLALLLGVNTFCNQMGFATLVLLSTVTLHLTTRQYGLLLVGVGVGSVVGGLVNSRVADLLGAVPAFVAALAVNAVLYVGMGLAPNGIVLGALIALCGFVITISSVVTVSLRQQIVPTHLLGRVNSVFRMLGWGLMPLGALAGGMAADAFGLRASFVVAGVLRGLALLVFLPVLIGSRTLRVKG